MKKVSRIGFLRANPNATYEEFFKETGGSKQNYHSNKWLIKKSVKPKKTKKTVSVKAHRRHPAGSAPALEMLLASNSVQIKTMAQTIDEVRIENEDLKHQIIGFRAVISYLEDMAGLRSSQ
jgi:hypothetical protein